MSEVEGGRPFSEVVNAAKRLGFTEPGNGCSHTMLVLIPRQILCIFNSVQVYMKAQIKITRTSVLCY